MPTQAFLFRSSSCLAAERIVNKLWYPLAVGIARRLFRGSGQFARDGSQSIPAYRFCERYGSSQGPRPYRPIHFVLFTFCCRLATLLFRVPLCYAARISIHVAAVSVLAGKVMTRIGSLRLCGLCGSNGPGGGGWQIRVDLPLQLA